MTLYDDYAKAKAGMFFGIGGGKLAVICVALLPVFVAVNRQAWLGAAVLLGLWLAASALMVLPVRGRSAFGWIAAMTSFAVAGLLGRSTFRSRAARGDLGKPAGQTDLPGVLASVAVHDGPPLGPAQARIAIIQNHSAKTWSVTASVVHPGIGMAEPAKRDQLGRALSGFLDACEQTQLISAVSLMVRTVPDDGAERRQWMNNHRIDGGPSLSRRVNDDLLEALATASVRTEQFITFTVPERRLAKSAKEAGGGFDGRAAILYGLMSEVESHLRSGMGIANMAWLTSPELFLAVRSGFAPGDRASIIDALQHQGVDVQVNAGLDWAVAGPSGADVAVRHYSHDAWNSVSATIRLPDKGALMGALAPVLMPSVDGERRSFAVVFPIMDRQTADRQASRAASGATLAEGLRAQLKINPRARERISAAKAHGLDEKLARGDSLITPYAVCSVTVPKTKRVAHHAQGLDASIRRAGFNPLRLDVSHDAGFAVSTIPLGIDLKGPRA
ncbi:hypothetical protein ASD11_14560 [Aeromicrobium sp. Root495]|uniref:SCO6880 family protein n=1 Tax=Aeromicrobium sp. Root495 TaxID=1736550 RepID=UPI0006FBAA52|nr:SCO6880 family protein [Aeromicrobium sp. Root495]KQY55731.1 hypothetical protein ASD11_14560 [Aeromicrobium sp. Root495]